MLNHVTWINPKTNHHDSIKIIRYFDGSVLEDLIELTMFRDWNLRIKVSKHGKNKYLEKNENFMLSKDPEQFYNYYKKLAKQLKTKNA